MSDNADAYYDPDVPHEVDLSKLTPEEWDLIGREIELHPSPFFEEVLGAVAGGAGSHEQISWAQERLG